jgi:hypothetical protein
MNKSVSVNNRILEYNNYVYNWIYSDIGLNDYGH